MSSLSDLQLQYDLEQLFTIEAELLDERRYDEWLELLDEDFRYWMPIARNVPFDRPDEEYTHEQSEASWFDEGKDDLRKRVLQIQGGDHWAEEPRSRTTHVATNVHVVEAREGLLKVNSRFVVYRTRLADNDDDVFVGKRIDLLRQTGDSFKLVHRTVHFDQSVLMTKYLTIFF